MTRTAPDVSDETLFIRRLHHGDAAAYGVLIDAYGARLYRFFFAMHRRADLAEDQASDSLAALVDAFMRRKVEPGNLGAYVFGVARNVLRRQWRHRARQLVPLEEAAEIQDRDPTPEERDASRRALERAAGLLAELPEGAREATYLRFVEQLSLMEIGQVLHLPVGTVKSHIHRARRKLFAELRAAPQGNPLEERS